MSKVSQSTVRSSPTSTPSASSHETMLAVDTWGRFNFPKLIAMAPLGIRALRRGKLPMPWPFHHKLPGAQHVGRIFKRLEGKK